jgi:type VI secretion system protein VasJ
MDLWVIGKEPISPDQPTGNDVRYEPEFEKLQAEIDKLSSPTEAVTDWKKVVGLGTQILEQKSKDLLVASYLAVALIHRQQVEGIGIGLRVLSDLLEQFWDNLHPPKKRMRGRVAAIRWWLEKSETALSGLKVGPLPSEQLAQLTEDLERIQHLLGEQFKEPFSLRSIQEFIKTIPDESEQEPEPETIKEPHVEQAKPAAEKKEVAQPLPAEPSEEIASAKDAQRVLNFGLQKIRQAAAFLREENLANPQIYRWARITAWSTVASLPPAKDGQTRIPPPDAQIINMLTDLRAKGDWQALIRAAEARLSQFIFWLDLNWFAAEALADLGDKFDDAYEVVCQETAALVHRLAGLQNLSFADGTPFADADTRQWLQGIALGESTGMAGIPPVLGTASSGEDSVLMAEEIQKAQALAKKKKLVEAVESLQQHLHNSSSERDRLLWRLALSQLLANSKKPGLALPHLGHILRDLDLYRLDKWDPELALSALKTVLVGLNSQSDQDSKKNATEVLSRIATLDPAEALRLEKP